jgi:DNA primase large subunit
MQQETVRFTSTDLSRYPFLKETTAYMKNPNLGFTKSIGLDIEELLSPEMGQILIRARERLESALEFISVGTKINSDLEIPSFPVAILLAIATKNNFVKKRFALAEAKQACLDFQSESPERLKAIARDFGWNIERSKELGLPIDYFSISIADYLRNITHLRDNNWKLVNRLVAHGKVLVGLNDVARLLEEEVKRRIETRLEAKDVPQFPIQIVEIADKLVELAKQKIGESEMEGFPKEVSQSAFPPCIIFLYDAASHGRHLGHVERFTLTSFLIAIGMETEKVAEVFKTSSDFNSRLTRYQVEHIAGSHGSGTKYTPPSCSTLQTHGVCTNTDALCTRVHHPLNYYLRKNRTTQTSLPVPPTRKT